MDVESVLKTISAILGLGPLVPSEDKLGIIRRLANGDISPDQAIHLAKLGILGLKEP
jgi:hypothetical protein